MFKKIVGKLKVTSENILDYLLYKKKSETGEQYKFFNVEILATPLSRKKFYELCEMSDSQDEQTAFKRSSHLSKMSSEIAKKLIKEYKEDYLMRQENVLQGVKDKIFEKRLTEIDKESKKEQRVKGLLLQGYIRINDVFFYTVGVSHGYGYYKFFAFNGGERISLTITGKDKELNGRLKDNTILSSFSMEEGAYNENFVCGVGALKEVDKDESTYFVEENIFNTQEAVRFFTKNFKTLQSLFKSDEFFSLFYENTEEAINTNTYKVYNVKEKVEVLPILKKYEEKIRNELKEKYGKCYFSEFTYEDKLTGERRNFIDDLMEIIGKNVDDAIKHFPTRLNEDAKGLVKNAFTEIFINCYCNYEDIGVSYLCQTLSNYDFYDTVCKEDIYKVYTTNLLDHLKGVETLAKDVLCAFKDSEMYYAFSGKEEMQAEEEMEEIFEEKGFLEAFCSAKHVGFLKENLRRMKFNETQIKNILLDFYAFESLQEDVVEEIATKALKNGKDLNNDEYIIKSSEYVYKQVMIECSKTIVGKMRKEQRKNFVNSKDKSFVRLYNYKNGKVNPAEEKEKPSDVEKETCITIV